jgi:hypothetical protein
MVVIEVGGVASTCIVSVVLAFRPDASVTVSVTTYEPGSEKMMEGDLNVLVRCPSYPKSQKRDETGPLDVSLKSTRHGAYASRCWCENRAISGCTGSDVLTTVGSVVP